MSTNVVTTISVAIFIRSPLVLTLPEPPKLSKHTLNAR